MKVDKDAILKQKFWILLGVFALLWLLSLSVLWAYAGGPIDAAKKSFDDAQTAIKKFTGANRPKNENFLPPWNVHKELFTKHKNTVWQAAWDGDKVSDTDAPLPVGQKRWEGQKSMYTWPSSREYDLQKDLAYPDSPFDIKAREWYKTKEGYASQFDDLRGDLKGATDSLDLDKPLSSVDFKGGFDGVMKPVDWETKEKPPDAEECWLAQEDFWVRREVLYTLRDALAMAAALDPVDAEFEKTPPDAKYLARHVFRNASWEVTLLFDKSAEGKLRISPDSSIKNVHVSHRDQDLGSPKMKSGVWFRLKQGGQTLRSFAVEGVKVAWEQSANFGKDGVLVSVPDVKGPMELEQVFDPTNTPIIAVNDIAIPFRSHRNANRPLIPAKPERFGKKEPPADAAKPATGATPAGPSGVIPPMGANGSPPPGMGSPSGPGAYGSPGVQPGGQGAQKDASKTANGFFDRNRYIFVTEQSRHLPVAVTLNVDQSHLGEILVAIANSRLRFQTTQVEFRRIHGYDKNAATSPAGGGEKPNYPSRPPMMSYMPPMGSLSGPPGVALPMSSPPPMIPGGTTPPTTTPTTTAAADEDNPNLIEVTIYGIASLYERPRSQ